MLQLGSFVLSAGHDPSRRQVETMMRIIARRCGPLRFDVIASRRAADTVRPERQLRPAPDRITHHAEQAR